MSRGVSAEEENEPRDVVVYPPPSLAASVNPTTSYPPRRPLAAADQIAHSLANTSIMINGGGAVAAAAQSPDEDTQTLDGEGDLVWSRDGTLTTYLLKLSLVAGCSGLLFGWDTGVAAGVLVAIKSDLGHSLSAGEQELVVSATTGEFASSSNCASPF